MTDLDLDALEAVARAATPGPWEYRHESPSMNGENCTIRQSGVPGIRMSAHVYGFGTGMIEHIAAFDPPTVLALITRIREAERHNVQLLREAVKREGRVRRAEGAIAEALNHDPLHGRKEGMHCGGMAPCIRDALTAYKPTNQEGEPG